MKTANGILTLIQEYAVDYHDGYYAKATANRLVKLRAAIEELHKDAARLEWAMHYIPGVLHGGMLVLTTTQAAPERILMQLSTLLRSPHDTRTNH